jgi:hypothetical protein
MGLRYPQGYTAGAYRQTQEFWPETYDDPDFATQ